MLAELERKIHYAFKDEEFLKKALRHKSEANEFARKSKFLYPYNECLEFLGDAVIELVVSHMLWERFPSVEEGELSKMRSGLVNEKSLAKIARSIDLGKYLLLGKGEDNSGGRQKDSILSSAYEALLGAVYVEGGPTPVYRIVEEHFFREALSFDCDYKSSLQELVQKKFQKVPVYRVCREEGPDHRKVFWVSVSVKKFFAKGEGCSKKEAEQAAARLLFQQLEEDKSLGTPEVRTDA